MGARDAGGAASPGILADPPPPPPKEKQQRNAGKVVILIWRRLFVCLTIANEQHLLAKRDKIWK